MNTRRYFFRFNAADLCGANHDLRSVIDPLTALTGAEGAFVYRAGAEADEFCVIAARTPSDPRIPAVGVTLSAEATALLRRGEEPLQTSAAVDERFSNLPEILEFGVRSLLIFPLRSADSVLGFLTLGRVVAQPFDAATIAAARPVARVIAAVLERDALQTALRERKLVERAKGVVQRARRVSEEEAYAFLRNRSRRTQRPLSEVADEVLRESLLRKTA
jgi:GAF domain-containing protein